MLQPECNEGPSASTATVTGLLQLAMNSSSHTAVEAAACHIPAQLEPEAARKLLTTAALRQHFSTVQHVAGLAVMRRHADAATLQSVLMDLVTRASTRDVWLDVMTMMVNSSPSRMHTTRSTTYSAHYVSALSAQCLQQHS
jgi:hypothetical protein